MSESLQTTRRNLLRVSLASATAAMLPVGMSRAAEWNESQPWDVETDVVVVGYGAAGAAAAIEAPPPRENNFCEFTECDLFF